MVTLFQIVRKVETNTFSYFPIFVLPAASPNPSCYKRRLLFSGDIWCLSRFLLSEGALMLLDTLASLTCHSLGSE
jgi:hypothetical protein